MPAEAVPTLYTIDRGRLRFVRGAGSLYQPAFIVFCFPSSPHSVELSGRLSLRSFAEGFIIYAAPSDYVGFKSFERLLNIYY